MLAFVLALGVLVAPAGAQSPRAPFRIGIIVGASGDSPALRGLREGLQKLGYVEGRDYEFLLRMAEGGPERFSALAAELVAEKPDVIFAAASGVAVALKETTNSIPVVFGGINDPVKLRLVESIARPGGNFTGITARFTELEPKRLQLLKELLPFLDHAAILRNPPGRIDIGSENELRKTAAILGIAMTTFRYTGSVDLGDALNQLAQSGAKGVVDFDGPIGFANRKTIIAVMRDKRMPAIYTAPVYVREGGLISFGIDQEAEIRRSASYIDKILRGAKPADLPVEQAIPILAINLKTAAEIGITVPQSIAARAEEIVE